MQTKFYFMFCATSFALDVIFQIIGPYSNSDTSTILRSKHCVV